MNSGYIPAVLSQKYWKCKENEVCFYVNEESKINQKHAYLLLCHENLKQLCKLVSLLDYEYNDIYIHVDKKYKLSRSEKRNIELTVQKAQVIFIKSKKASWGGDSLMKIEVSLLKNAVKNSYVYYHLISGADLPLKPQKEIHRFFNNSGRDYIALEKQSPANLEKSFLDRFQYYYFFQNKVSKNNRAWKKRQKTLLKLQKRLRIDRTKSAPFQYIKGSQWFSITHETALYILKSFKRYKKFFLHSYIPDESFVHSIINNSSLISNVVDDNMRYIDWNRGSPYVFRLKDYEELMNSGKMFARKFDERIDNSIIDMIYKRLTLQ